MTNSEPQSFSFTQGCLQLTPLRGCPQTVRFAHAGYASTPPSAAYALVSASGCGFGDFVKKRICNDQPTEGIQVMPTEKKSTVRHITISTVGAALLAVVEPIIAILNAGAPEEMGHELPSRKDPLLRILLNNFCRDVYQQIHGVDTPNYKFAGVKDNWDRAQNAVAQLVSRYSNNPEDMDADPNCVKFDGWYQSSSAKMEALTSLLVELQDTYKTVTGEDWKYQAPGTGIKKVQVSSSDAAAKLRSIAAAKQASAA
jgi:hypothetical protein